MLAWLTQWIKSLVAFLLISGLLLMLMPDTDLKGFLRFVVGLLLIALLIGPLVGGGALGSLDELVFGLSQYGGPNANGVALDAHGLELRAEGLLEKGSGVMREYMENQTNRQLGSLLGLFSGIDEAQVISQVNSKGQLERVVVQLRLAPDESREEDLPLAYIHDGEEINLSIRPVQPVVILDGDSPDAHTAPVDSHGPLAKRVGNWVADFFGIDEGQVMVNIL